MGSVAKPEDGGSDTPRSRLGALDRLRSFRVTYIAIFAFLLLYVFTVKAAEEILERYFVRVVAADVQITNFSVPVTLQIQSRIDRNVMHSRWVRWGGVQATVIVLGKDGRTWIYVGGRTQTPPSLDPAAIAREAERLLPATSEVIVSVPHNALLANAILVGYAAILITGLFFYHRRIAQRESRAMESALAAREASQERAASIERELEAVRERLLSVEPTERGHSEEITALQGERESLQRKLAALAEREEELRLKAARATELDQERQALEELLEEAGADLASKDDEIRSLERSLKRASKATAPSAGRSRSREGDLLGRRLRTLYKALEFDDRAITDMIALRDETMKLKAEESLKRLADETENVAVRRKVGGLPPHLSIFELGFAGKGRIYYTRGAQRRFRVLAIGAKNTQKTDLEYLRRLSL